MHFSAKKPLLSLRRRGEPRGEKRKPGRQGSCYGAADTLYAIARVLMSEDSEWPAVGALLL